MKPHACWACWPRIIARIWRAHYSAPLVTALSPGRRWSGSWRRKHVPAPDGNRYRPRRRTNSTRSSGSLPSPLAPRRSTRRCWKKRWPTMKATKTTTPLRDRCLSHCATLGIPLEGVSLDELLSRAEKEGLSHLHFLDLLLGAQADARRERAVARRIREARFADSKTLEGFNWQFNPKAFDRMQIEELATGDFIRRCNNLIMVGWSGIGKS